jgi:TolB-like protein
MLSSPSRSGSGSARGGRGGCDEGTATCSPVRDMRLLDELKRRKVVRVAAVYAATGFVVLQAADLILPRLGVPDWAMSLIVVLLLLGVPVALVLGWALELTPAGVRVTQATSAESRAAGEPLPSLLGRRTMLVAALLLVLGTALGAGWFLRPAAHAAAEEGALAVLPFDNYSPDPADAYFAGGITEEITSQLARLSRLRLMSRTAVARALEGQRSLAEVAAELGINSVLEGSVRLAGERVRITAQLVDPRTGRQLWSEDYDRELANIFEIQSEVALAIVTAMRARIAPEEAARLAAAPTADLAAYQLYLRDSQLSGNVPAENRLGIQMLRDAVALDPRFEQAWSRLAWRQQWAAFHGDEAGRAKAMEYSEIALALNPLSPHAHRARAAAHVAAEHHHAALASFLRALELDPNHQGSLADGGIAASLLGSAADGLRLSARVLPTGPNVPNLRYHVGMPMLLMDDDDRLVRWLDLAAAEGMEFHRLELLRILLDVRQGRPDQALVRLREASARLGAHPEFDAVAADVLHFLGRHDEARPMLERSYEAAARTSPLAATGRSSRLNLALVLAAAGETQRAHALFDEALRLNLRMIEEGSDSHARRIDIATIHAARGEAAAAVEWLNRAYDAGYRAHRLLRQDAAFEALRGDDGFGALLARMEEANARERARVAAERIASAVDAMIAAGPTRRQAP